MTDIRARLRVRLEIASALDATVLVRALYEVVDELTQRALDEQDARLACGRNCVYCCYESFAISRAEVHVLARYLAQRLHPDNVLTLASVLMDYEAATSGLSPAERYQREMPCPLLDEDSGTCVVYPVRPLRCRGKNSLAVEPCRRNCHEGSASGASLASLDDVAAAAIEVLAVTGAAVGIPAELLAFAPALRAALDEVF